MIRMVLAQAGLAAAGLGLIVSATVVPRPTPVQADVDGVPADTPLRVTSADGQPLNLYAGPAADQAVVAVLLPDEIVTLLGNAQVNGLARWVPVRTAGNQIGWISDQYLVLASEPLAAASPGPDGSAAEAATPTPEPMPSPLPFAGPGSATPTVETKPSARRTLDVEVKVKYPEAKTRHQEVNILVTRDGVPISGATVTIFAEDDENEPVRILDPTDAEGRTRREFAISREKGTIELVVSAVAPDGAEGRTSVTYFRR